MAKQNVLSMAFISISKINEEIELSDENVEAFKGYFKELKPLEQAFLIEQAVNIKDHMNRYLEIMATVSV